MKSSLIRSGLAAASVLLATVSAQAQEPVYQEPAQYKAPRYKAPAYVAPAAFSWSGFYVGANLGYAFGSSDWTSPAVSTDPSGVLVGLTLGYNYQTGIWVWGLEGDIAYSTVEGDVACGAGTCTTALNWLGTARARIGYGGWSNFLPYITGGVAIGGLEATNSARTGSGKDTSIGWTAGLGLEYAMFSSWTFKLEYLYVDLGSFDCGTPCSATTPAEVDFSSHVIRAGVNYRF